MINHYRLLLKRLFRVILFIFMLSVVVV